MTKQTYTSHFIDSTTVSVDDDEIEIESIISGLNKIGFRMHLIAQKTIDRLEQTMTHFYNQCLLPLKGELKKQTSTPQLQHLKIDKKQTIHNSAD